MAITQTGKEPTILDTINELVLRLSIIAEDNDSWKQYQAGDEDKQVVIDRCENQITSYLNSLSKEMQRLRARALVAETEWSTFRHLTEQAREIIEHDHQINERSVESVEAPPSVKRFIQRSHDALKRAAPD